MSNTEAVQSKRTGIILMAFPLAVFLILVFMNTMAQNNGSSWHIKITGYDPRDILQGHYITYRYEWNYDEKAGAACTERGKNSTCCLCVNESGTGHVNPKISRFDCARDWRQQSCSAVIKSKNRYGRTIYPSTKYYIDQNYALKVEQLIREAKNDFYIDLSVTENGAAVIRDMYVGDMPLKEYLRRMPKAHSLDTSRSR